MESMRGLVSTAIPKESVEEEEAFEKEPEEEPKKLGIIFTSSIGMP